MKRTLMVLVFSGLLLNSSSAMASMVGECNALLAKLSGASHQVVNGIDVAGNCNELGGRLNDFANAGCIPLFDAGQLFNVHLRPDHSLVQAVCGALNCLCGLEVPACVGAVDCS